MKNLIKYSYYYFTALYMLLLVFACSESTSSSNTSQNTPEDSSAVKNLNAATLQISSACDRPLDVYISNASYKTPGNYQLTYTWNSVSNATFYEFNFLINGASVLQVLSVPDTFITFLQPITTLNSINASVSTVCGSTKSNAKESAEIRYMNAVNTDDIIFLAGPNTTVGDICALNCDKLFFTGNSIKNNNGSIIPLSHPEMKVHFYDYNTVKNCIQCSNSGAPIVDPTAFNNCLKSPQNNYWLYDPQAYTLCP